MCGNVFGGGGGERGFEWEGGWLEVFLGAGGRWSFEMGVI